MELVGGAVDLDQLGLGALLVKVVGDLVRGLGHQELLELLRAQHRWWLLWLDLLNVHEALGQIGVTLLLAHLLLHTEEFLDVFDRSVESGGSRCLFGLYWYW